MSTEDQRGEYDLGKAAFVNGTPCSHALDIPWESRRQNWMIGWLDGLAEHLGALSPPPENCRFEVERHGSGYTIRDNQEDRLLCGTDVWFNSHANADKKCKALNVKHQAQQVAEVPSGKRAVDVGE